MSQPDERVAEALLRGPVAADDAGSRWAYHGPAAALVSLFILYHAVALLQHTTPSTGLAEKWSRKLGGALKIGAYMRATSSVQSWAMFAPNPHRTNMYLQVRVETADGDEYDLRHDIYGQRNYPYFFYDRMGKINRRLLEQERYQAHYAAWVCRDWALSHGGEAPVKVHYTKMWTKLPPPAQAVASGGFDPYALKLYKEDLASFECATTVHAQLPDHVRARHGLPPLPPGAFRDLDEPTWYDRAEARAKIIERRRAADVGRGKTPPAEQDAPAEPAEPGEGGAAAEGGE